jgi:hypothetical protein
MKNARVLVGKVRRGRLCQNTFAKPIVTRAKPAYDVQLDYDISISKEEVGP